MIKKNFFAVLFIIFSVFCFGLDFSRAESPWTITIYTSSQEEGAQLASQLREVNPSAEVNIKNTNNPIAAIQFGLQLGPSDTPPFLTVGVMVPGVAPGIAKMLATVWQPTLIAHGNNFTSIFPRKENFPLAKAFFHFEDNDLFIIICGLTHCGSGRYVYIDMLPPSFRGDNYYIPFDNR